MPGIRSNSLDQSITVFESLDAAAPNRMKAISESRSKIDLSLDSIALLLSFQVENTKTELMSAFSRGVTVRLLTEVTQETLPICVELSRYAKIRHRMSIEENIVIADSASYTHDRLDKDKVDSKVIHSKNPVIVRQHEYLFEALWESAVALEDRIRALSDDKKVETIQIRGTKDAMKAILGVLERAKDYCYAYGDLDAPSLAVGVEPYRHASEAMKERGVRQRAITEITKENLEYCKQLMLVCELRHLEGSRGNFVVTEREFLAADIPIAGQTPLDCILYSNSGEIVQQHERVFELLWKNALPAVTRFDQLERGDEKNGKDAKLMRDLSEGQLTSKTLMMSAKEELLLIFPSEDAIRREDLPFISLSDELNARGLKVRMLAPISSSDIARQLGDIEWKSIEPINACFVIADRNAMVSVFYRRSSAEAAREQQVSSYLLTTNNQAVTGMCAIFQELWENTALKEMYERTRREAALFHDVLTHDVANYNQVSRLSAEMLQEELQDNESVKALTESLLEAVRSETLLVDRAKKFARIIANKKDELYAVHLFNSIERSLSSAKDIHPDKTVSSTIELLGRRRKEKDKVYVLADALLDEVFVNLFSNCLKHSKTNEVLIEVVVQEAELPFTKVLRSQPYSKVTGQAWLVSIADYGRGISDEAKRTIFRRYENGYKGSGLGMSIVRELVVARYGGIVRIENRVKNDYTQGALVKVYLRKAP